MGSKRHYIRIFLSILFISCFSCSNSDTEEFVFDETYFNQNFNKESEYIILLPDIQNYISNSNNTKYLESIIDWVFLFGEFGYNVKAVLQVGDVTNFNSTEEWETARHIFRKLDHHVNYMFCTGNHDYGEDGICNTRDTDFSTYFDYTTNTAFISSFEKGKYENCHFQFNLRNQAFQVFSLEFGPRDKVLAWADSIAKTNMNKTGMVLTHAYLHQDNERFNYEKYKSGQVGSPISYGILHPDFGIGGVNDGEMIWTKLITHNPNLRFVFSGHKTDPDYLGFLKSKNTAGKDVFQFLFNTQDLINGGNGIIQLLEFQNDTNAIGIRTFSTYSNEWDHDLKSEFQIYLN